MTGLGGPGSPGEPGSPPGGKGGKGGSGGHGESGEKGARGRTGKTGAGARSAILAYVILFMFSLSGLVYAEWKADEATDALLVSQMRGDRNLALQALRSDEAVRQANLESCQRRNEVRKAFRQEQREDIEATEREIQTTRSTNSALFPDIPPEKFAQLIERSVQRLRAEQVRDRRQRRRLPDIDCPAEHPPISVYPPSP